jgi:hypothetical protein
MLVQSWGKPLKDLEDDDLQGYPNEEISQVQNSWQGVCHDKFENVNKDNSKEWLQSDACELGFQHMTDMDIANAAVKQKGEETERRGRIISTPAAYSGGPRFKSRPGNRLSWLRFFVVFLSPSRQMPGQYLKLGHDLSLPHPFQLIIHYHPLIQRYIVWDTKSIVE